MGGSITVARIGGVPIRIHFTWVFILALMIWSLGQIGFPDSYPGWSRQTYWVTATVAALLLFVSVILHELSHAFMALARGQKVRSITLFIFGGATAIEEGARSPRAEFLVAVVGPLTSIVIGAACFALTRVGGFNQQVKAVLDYLASVNLLLGVFNLLPGLPLDGGRVLRALVWGRTKDQQRATAVAAGVSRSIGYLLIVAGIVLTFAGAGFQGLWIAFVGWFIESSAGSTLQQGAAHSFLEGVTVRDAMRTDFQTVVPALPISALVEEYIQTGHQRSFPVFGGGQLWGIVTLADVAHWPQSRWQETPVERIMTPRERLKTVKADAQLEAVLAELQHAGVKQLVVLADDGDRVAGMLSRADLMDFLQVRQLVFRNAQAQVPA